MAPVCRSGVRLSTALRTLGRVATSLASIPSWRWGGAPLTANTPFRPRCGLFIRGRARRSFPWLPTNAHDRSLPSKPPLPSTAPPLMTFGLATSPTLSFVPSSLLGLRLPPAARLAHGPAGRRKPAARPLDARPSGRLSLACPCRLSARPRTGLRFVLPSAGLAVAAGLG